MRTLIVFLSALLSALLGCTMAHGSIYSYPEDKRPAVSLKDACTIAETILGKLGLKTEAFVVGASIAGDKGQTGDGAWILYYQNTQGDKIQIAIPFPEDVCYVMLSPKEGGYSEKGYTRDGLISPKWIAEQAKFQKDKEDAEKAFGPAVPTK